MKIRYIPRCPWSLFYVDDVRLGQPEPRSDDYFVRGMTAFEITEDGEIRGTLVDAWLDGRLA